MISLLWAVYQQSLFLDRQHEVQRKSWRVPLKLYTQGFSLAYPNLSGPWWTLIYLLSFAAFDDPSLTVFSSIFPHITKLFQKPFQLANQKLIRYDNNNLIINIYMYAGVELVFRIFEQECGNGNISKVGAIFFLLSCNLFTGNNCNMKINCRFCRWY